MGYGALSGIPIVISSTLNSVSDQHVIQIHQENQNLTERSPLIAREAALFRQQPQEKVLNWKSFSLLAILVVGVFIAVHLLVIEYSEESLAYPFHLIRQDLWYETGSFDHLNVTPLNSSHVSNVILFHTRGNACFNSGSCLFIISEMLKQNLSDIPFNFLIGGDGKTYELRGWNLQSGFEYIPFNNEALAVGLIGDFTLDTPTKKQKQAFSAFLLEAVRRKKLDKNYKIHLVGIAGSEWFKIFESIEELTLWAGW